MSALEVATIWITPGQEDAFASAYRRGRHLLTEIRGCLSVRLTRGVESPSVFVLLVEWDAVATHLVEFRATERFEQWRGLIGPYFAKPPHVEHFVDVAADLGR